MGKPLVVAMLLGTLACQSGCRSHAWLRRGTGEPPPIAFTALPSPTEAVGAVKLGIARPSSIPGSLPNGDSERRRPKNRRTGRAKARDEP